MGRHRRAHLPHAPLTTLAPPPSFSACPRRRMATHRPTSSRASMCAVERRLSEHVEASRSRRAKPSATSRAERAPRVCVCACLQHLVAMKAAADKAAADKAAVDKALADNAQPDAQLAAAIAASLGLSALFTPPTPSWAADTAFKGRVSKAESERSSRGHLQDLSRGTPTERRAITFNPPASMRQANAAIDSVNAAIDSGAVAGVTARPRLDDVLEHVKMLRRLAALQARWPSVDASFKYVNSFFRVLAKQVYGDEQLHGLARHETIRIMHEHREEFEKFVHGDFDSYVSHLSREGTHVKEPIRILDGILDGLLSLAQMKAGAVVATAPASMPINDTELRRRLTPVRANGWQPVDMVGDGNSFFRVLAKQVYGDKQLHGRARQETIRYMREHREEFEQFVPGDFDSFVDNLSREGTHVEGTDVEIKAAADAFNMCVTAVYGRSTNHDRTSTPSLLLPPPLAPGRSTNHDKTSAPLISDLETRGVYMAHYQAKQHSVVLERMDPAPLRPKGASGGCAGGEPCVGRKSIHEGEYKAGKKEGRGIFRSADGAVYLPRASRASGLPRADVTSAMAQAPQRLPPPKRRVPATAGPPPQMRSYEEQMAWALQQSTLDAQAEAPTEAQKAAFFAKVGASLEQVRSATRLDWSRKGLSAGDCKVIAHLIAAKLPVLTTLILWKNNIGDEGAKAIAEALKVNTVLTVLYLGENNIGDDGAKAIAEALKVNPVKTTVLLGDNNIGDEGAIAIAEVLKDIAVVC